MVLRPLAEGDEAELRRIHGTPEVVRWWDVPAAGFPWTDDPDASPTGTHSQAGRARRATPNAPSAA
jgi:hypothetical protein